MRSGIPSNHRDTRAWSWNRPLSGFWGRTSTATAKSKENCPITEKKGPKYLLRLLELPVGSVLLPLVQVFDHWVNNRLLIIAFCQIAKGTTSISLVSNGVIQWLASIWKVKLGLTTWFSIDFKTIRKKSINIHFWISISRHTLSLMIQFQHSMIWEAYVSALASFSTNQ